jgi:hypothetical protein
VTQLSARAGPPADRGTGTGELDLAQQLFAGVEVMQRHLCQRLSLDRHNPLVTILVAALINGEGEISRTQQCLGGGTGVVGQQSLQLRFVGQRVATQFAGIGAVGQQHGDGSVTLRLQAERSAELQRGGQAGREGKRLSHQHGHHRMVVVAGQQRIGQRAQAYKPASHRPLWEKERQDTPGHDKVGHGRAAAIKKSWRCRHRRKIGISQPRRYPGCPRGQGGLPRVGPGEKASAGRRSVPGDRSGRARKVLDPVRVASRAVVTRSTGR